MKDSEAKVLEEQMKKVTIPEPSPVLSREEMGAGRANDVPSAAERQTEVTPADSAKAYQDTEAAQSGAPRGTDAGTAAMLDGISEGRRSAAERYISEIESRNAAEKGMYDDYLSELSNQAKAWEDMRKAEEEKDKKMKKREALGGTLLGVGEAMSSLINLTGVANGAANQTTPSYSKEWQKRADSERKERQSKIEDLSERQRQARDNVLKARIAAQQAALNREDKRSKAVHDAALDEYSTAWEQYKYNRKQDADEKKAAAAAAHQQEQDKIKAEEARTRRINANANAGYKRKAGEAAVIRAKNQAADKKGKDKDKETSHALRDDFD